MPGWPGGLGNRLQDGRAAVDQGLGDRLQDVWNYLKSNSSIARMADPRTSPMGPAAIARMFADPAGETGRQVETGEQLAKPFTQFNDPNVDPVKQAADLALTAMGGSSVVPAEANAVGTGIRTRLYHGSPRADLKALEPSTRGPLGEGVYTTPHEGLAGRYAGEEGRTYALPERERDIFLGHGHRTDEEWAGFKRDKERLLEAAEPDKKQELSALLDRMWSGDGYPTFARISQMYGGDAKAHELFRRAGFEGLSGQVDGPEVLLFGKQGLGIKAYHGSPHDFERFDSSKIGSGEGAQAYGHGLYFAENEGVARSYKPGANATYLANDVVKGHVASALKSAYKAGLSGQEAKKEALRYLQEYADNAGQSARRQEFHDAINNFDALSDLGHMYEVDIAADPEHFLDWDKPLSEQPKVQAAIEKAGLPTKRESKWYAEKIGREQRPVWHNNRYYISQNGPKDFVYGKGSHYDQTGVIGFASTKEAAQKALEDAAMEMPPKTGQEVLRDLKYKTVGYGPDYGPQSSQVLREAGIPGVKYLDEGSRGAGDGTRNYVVFPGNEHLIAILKKYGLPISAAGLAALSQMQGGEAQAQPLGDRLQRGK
jgi:hypothetical protein